MYLFSVLGSTNKYYNYIIIISWPGLVLGVFSSLFVVCPSAHLRLCTIHISGREW